LDALGPRALREFALHFEFAELRLVVGVGNQAGAQAVALMAIINSTWQNFSNSTRVKLFGNSA